MAFRRALRRPPPVQPGIAGRTYSPKMLPHFGGDMKIVFTVAVFLSQLLSATFEAYLRALVPRQNEC